MKFGISFRSYLGAMPSRDYIFQDQDYETQLEKAMYMLSEADHILIGAGAGLSTAAGLEMGGKRWTKYFNEFEAKYGGPYMHDMYSAGFYPYQSQEAKWGFWSKSSLVNRVDIDALPLYKALYRLIEYKDYFVITTNVDAQFHKAGFDKDKIFATQGDYAYIQCKKACHHKVYDASDLFRKMDQARTDCMIPSELVPKCPMCGGEMEMNLRCDQYFVEDDTWHHAEKQFIQYLNKIQGKKVVLLELGCGFNTPTIIRYPFEKLMKQNKAYKMIRLNLNEAVVLESLEDRMVGINKDMNITIQDMNHFQLQKKTL